MSRTQAPSRQQPEASDAPQADALAQPLAAAIDHSPRMLAQRRQIQSLFGPGDHAKGVLQGYFEVSGQATNDPDQFVEGADQAAKEAQVWLTLKPALATAWQGLGAHHHYDAAILEEFRPQMMTMAFSADRKTLANAARLLEAVAAHRVAAQTPLEDRASPAGVGGTLTTSPALDDERVKHSRATYRRTTPAAGGVGAPTVSDETFDSDAYTKGPSRRTRDGGTATTPQSGAQAWTKKVIKDSIRIWTGDVPLVRHLAVTVWPLLGNTDLGRRWEVKFREMDRLITFRDGEAQSRYIVVKRTAGNVTVKTYDRKDYNKQARLDLKAAILAGTPHPDEQQGVLFYDALLKADADPAWRVADSATFQVGPGHTVVGDLSMILTHWRPILLFDWILAEDVLNNAADA